MQDAKEDHIADQILDSLASTKYACSSLQRFSGGSSAFTYRGYLKEPLPEFGASTIIIKHTEPYIALAPTWALDVSRSDYETIMLNALDKKTPTEYAHYRVKAPRSLLEPEPHTLLIEDLVDSLTLKDYLSEPICQSNSSPDLVKDLGFALGRWLISLHQWGMSDSPETNELRTQVARNPMKTLKYEVNIGRYLATVDHFPDLPWAERNEYVEIEKRIKQETSEEGSLIHGDFWPGNILLKDAALAHPVPTNDLSNMFIVDFEFSHLGCVSQDLGQCFAELWLIHHFLFVAAAAELITAIAEGYYSERTGGKSDALAFKVAMDMGIHLVNWPWRVGDWRDSPLLPDCIKFGDQLLLRGHKGDREWFRGGPLDAMFP